MKIPGCPEPDVWSQYFSLFLRAHGELWGSGLPTSPQPEQFSSDTKQSAQQTQPIAAVTYCHFFLFSHIKANSSEQGKHWRFRNNCYEVMPGNTLTGHDSSCKYLFKQKSLADNTVLSSWVDRHGKSVILWNSKVPNMPLRQPIVFLAWKRKVCHLKHGQKQCSTSQLSTLFVVPSQFEGSKVLTFFFSSLSLSASHLIQVFLACSLGLDLFASAVCPSSRPDAKVTDVQDGRGRPGHGEACDWIYQQALDIPMVLFISLKSHLCTGDLSAKPSWE